MKSPVFFLLLALMLPAAAAPKEPKHSVKPKAGLVPTPETAIQIAVAVWTPIYGKEKIESQKPWKAILMKGDVWYVNGSLPGGGLGGTAIAEIQKSDGKILRVSHGK